MVLGIEVGLSPGDFVLDGNPAPLSPKGGGGRAPKFSAYGCGQTVGWIKMPLGKEIGLGPGHTVLDGDPVGTQPQCSLSPLSALAYCGQTVAHLSNC